MKWRPRRGTRWPYARMVIILALLVGGLWLLSYELFDARCLGAALVLIGALWALLQQYP